MGAFDTTKNAIVGHGASAPVATTTAATSSAPPVPGAVAEPATKPAVSLLFQPPVVAVESILKGLAAKNAQRLNWQASIADFLKLLGLDSSLQNRTALAKELGYSGDPAGFARMNTWLQQQVMRKRAESGGKAPASLHGCVGVCAFTARYCRPRIVRKHRAVGHGRPACL